MDNLKKIEGKLSRVECVKGGGISTTEANSGHIDCFVVRISGAPSVCTTNVRLFVLDWDVVVR